jgi:hypothetical protein
MKFLFLCIRKTKCVSIEIAKSLSTYSKQDIHTYTYFLSKYISTSLIKVHKCTSRSYINNQRIGCVVIRVLASSAVNRGFEPTSDQTKDY